MAKNECAKTRPASDPYETWERAGWKWLVLKKYQANDTKPMARWFCKVYTPYTPDGELGDCYAAEIMTQARRTK